MYLNAGEKVPSISKTKIGDVYIYPDKIKVVCKCDQKGKKIIESTGVVEQHGFKIDMLKTHPENMKKRFDLLKENIMVKTEQQPDDEVAPDE